MLSHHSLHEPGLCTYFTGAACSAWHKVFLQILKHLLYNKSTTSSLLPTFSQSESSSSWLVFTPSQEIRGDFILTADIHLLICSCQHRALGSRECISVFTEMSKTECTAKAASSLTLCSENWHELRWTNTPARTKLHPLWRVQLGKQERAWLSFIALQKAALLQKGGLR